jgi:hypothetical protein
MNPREGYFRQCGPKRQATAILRHFMTLLADSPSNSGPLGFDDRKFPAAPRLTFDFVLARIEAEKGIGRGFRWAAAGFPEIRIFPLLNRSTGGVR